MLSFRTRGSKYRNARTEYGGITYDSKFEAGVARDLDIRVRAGEIAGWERQYKVTIPLYRKDGTLGKTVTHKVDFRVHELDGTFTLLEAKGVETPDYKMRRDLLMGFWMPEHEHDHRYEVVKDRGRNWSLTPGKGRKQPRAKARG